MLLMSHDEAETESTQPSRRSRHGIGRFVVPLAMSVAALVLAVSCKPATGGQTAASESSATVIATASAGPPPAPSPQLPANPPSKPGYRLVFSDEFSGSRLNQAKWAPGLAWGNTNRDEQQYYVPDALSQSNGQLIITAKPRTWKGKPYVSGAINSSKHFSFKYGYAEMRAQVPAGAGLWSAFWLMNSVPGSYQEADIVEVLGSDPSVGYAVLHFGTIGNRSNLVSTYRDGDLSAGMHTFAVDWQPGQMIWYMDGVERRRLTANIPANPMYVVANLSVGGAKSWSGPPDRYTPFPAQYRIDYIRVFQRK